MDKYATLNEPQRQAVMHTDGPLLLLAGAGSGKTRVLTHRIAYLIEEKHVLPWKIMAITFTNKAAKEMRERVDRLIGEGGQDVWVSTFHSSCVRILRRYIDEIDYDRNFSIYDTDDAKKLIREIMKEYNIDPKYFKESMILSEISSAKNQLIGPKAFQKQAEGDMRKEVISRVYKEYQQRLVKNNALDFDDLLCKTVELFEQRPKVLEYYHNLFSYIMVDEYQDTNGVQFRLVKLLADKHKNLCVVGDDDQSIYRFRGADIRNILDFESVYKDAKVIRLEQNYRSTKNILEAANEVIRNNRKRKAKKLWTDNPDGERIHHVQVNSESEEARFITDTIVHGIEDEGHEYYHYAILYRTNAQSRLLEEGLVRSGIPYRLVGGVSFYQRKEIKDIIAYLKVLNNSTDEIAAKRIINVPKRGIGNTTVERIQEYVSISGQSFMEGVNDIESIPNISRGKKNVAEFALMMHELKILADQGKLKRLMEELLERTGYIESLKADDPLKAEERSDNIGELVSKLYTYIEETEAAGEEPTLNAFLEDVALVADIDQMEDDDNKVILMTLHSAKGLEFPIVFMAGMEDGLFPSYMSMNSGLEEDIEEERRLCYVGITRAQDKLYMTSARSRMLYGNTNYNPVSRFVAEIPKELLDSNAVSGQSDLESQGIYNPIEERARRKASFKEKPYNMESKIPAPEGVVLDYDAGDLVKHPKYGIGQVKLIEAGGADYQVTVNFPSHGKKKLIASFAGLKKI
ncbi:DNA helicase PcrA [Vallitaleaceae bacterium 9-2]